MTELLRDGVRVAFGVDTTFSWGIWAFVTVLVAVVGVAFVLAAPRVVDPIAATAVARPARTLAWTLLGPLAALLLLLALIVTIVGIPLAVLAAVGLLLLATIGYIALALVLGDLVVRLVRGRGVLDPMIPSPAPWVATLLGVALLRTLRLVPLLGTTLHTFAAWYAAAAAAATGWAVAWSWHRRRLPDRVQFEGETLVEWYPDGDPPSGAPELGTGRPVLGNLRGDEDRERDGTQDEDQP